MVLILPFKSLKTGPTLQAYVSIGFFTPGPDQISASGYSPWLATKLLGEEMSHANLIHLNKTAS